MATQGAIISGGKGWPPDKIAALRDAGIAIAPTPADGHRPRREVGLLIRRMGRPANRSYHDGAIWGDPGSLLSLGFADR